MSILVRQSRLDVGSDSVQFPTVSGFNLNRQELEFPRDFRGDLNLLFVPFLQPQQFVVNTWIPLADELEAIFPELAYYELPTIESLPALSRTFINEGMRAGIPNAKARANARSRCTSIRRDSCKHSEFPRRTMFTSCWSIVGATSCGARPAASTRLGATSWRKRLRPIRGALKCEGE